MSDSGGLQEAIDCLREEAGKRNIESIDIVSGESAEGKCVIRIELGKKYKNWGEGTIEGWSDNTVEDIKPTSDEQLTKAEKTIIIQQKIENLKDTFRTGKGLFEGEDKIFKNIGEYLVSLKGNEEQVNRWVDQYLKDYTRWRLFDKRAIKAKEEHDARILKVSKELDKWKELWRKTDAIFKMERVMKEEFERGAEWYFDWGELGGGLDFGIGGIDWGLHSGSMSVNLRMKRNFETRWVDEVKVNKKMNKSRKSTHKG